MSLPKKVRCPADCKREYLTPGKVYNIYEVDEYGFNMIDDEGDELGCLFHRCSHLDGTDWEVIQ